MEYPIGEGVGRKELMIRPPLAVGSTRQQVPPNVGEDKTGSIVVDPPPDTFWQHTILNTPRDEYQLTDEEESVEGLTQVSSRDFRFFQDGQRVQANSTEDTGEGGCSHDATMMQQAQAQAQAKPTNTKPHSYRSFCEQESDAEDDEQDSDIDSCIDDTQAIHTQAIDYGIASHTGVIYSCEEDEPFDIQAAADDEIASIDQGVVVLPDIEGATEESSVCPSNTSRPTDSDSDSTLPTRPPPSSPIRTCKAPKEFNGFRRRCSRHSSKGSSRHTNQTASSVTNGSTLITDCTDHSDGGYSGSLDSPPSIPFQRTSNKKQCNYSKPKITFTDRKHSSSTTSSGRSGTLHSQSQGSHQHTQQTNSSSSSSGRPPCHQEQSKNKPRPPLTKRMPRRNKSAGVESSGVLSVAEDSLAPSIMTRWRWHCDNLWSPILLFVTDLWDYEEPNTKAADDDNTLATFDEELSYEDEGNVNVFLAVEATVLGTDFPTAIEVPKNHMPHIWGSNFVGVVQSPRGDTVHSRRFPPGCRVASISAWSASSHHPYISANSSNLLPVPPLDGLHLDGSDVSVIVAAYLPAFQALHHGLRHKPRAAYEPTALEGQRVLILTHSESSSSQKSSSLNQSLADARVQAAVKMALWAGARDVHVTVPKVGNTKRNIFGNDYRVRLLDTPPEDWIPILRSRMNLVLDYTGPVSGFLFGAESTCSIAEQVLAGNGRYVGCLGEGCSSPVLDCHEEAPINKRNKATWTEGLSMLQGQKGCASPAILPEAKDIRQVIEWTALCMQMERASLFDFHGSWKHDGRLAEHDFNFLLQLLAKRQIRPYIAKVLDVDYFPSVEDHQQFRNTRPMTGAVVCEPWSQYKDSDQSSCM